MSEDRGEDGAGDDRRALSRTCAATRTVRPVDALIRFVRAPDGTVVPDLKRKLPGRGVWVTASRDVLAEAIRRKAFSRGFKGPVTVTDLPEEVEGLLQRTALDMLSMANKAGRVVTGFAKVEQALAGDAVALVHASDGGEDGKRKLAAATRRLREGRDVPTREIFTSGQMDLALGRQNVIHAALLAGPVSNALLARIDDLARYRSGAEPSAPVQDDETGQPAGTDSR
ncbi:RNA-binding protein [Terrihabitans sp. B22-R8]|uniref:RNA-binding protein n=1 Tax=Terrihabitans sp. B22-R8 TaxID=3425128 RepID=UPI00403D1C7D